MHLLQKCLSLPISLDLINHNNKDKTCLWQVGHYYSEPITCTQDLQGLRLSSSSCHDAATVVILRRERIKQVRLSAC